MTGVTAGFAAGARSPAIGPRSSRATTSSIASSYATLMACMRSAEPPRSGCSARASRRRASAQVLGAGGRWQAQDRERVGGARPAGHSRLQVAAGAVRRRGRPWLRPARGRARRSSHSWSPHDAATSVGSCCRSTAAAWMQAPVATASSSAGTVDHPAGEVGQHLPVRGRAGAAAGEQQAPVGRRRRAQRVVGVQQPAGHALERRPRQLGAADVRRAARRARPRRPAGSGCARRPGTGAG